jgi:hypothetical protein
MLIGASTRALLGAAVFTAAGCAEHTHDAVLRELRDDALTAKRGFAIASPTETQLARLRGVRRREVEEWLGPASPCRDTKRLTAPGIGVGCAPGDWMYSFSSAFPPPGRMGGGVVLLLHFDGESSSARCVDASVLLLK